MGLSDMGSLKRAFPDNGAGYDEPQPKRVKRTSDHRMGYVDIEESEEDLDSLFNSEWQSDVDESEEGPSSTEDLSIFIINMDESNQGSSNISSVEKDFPNFVKLPGELRDETSFFIWRAGSEAEGKNVFGLTDPSIDDGRAMRNFPLQALIYSVIEDKYLYKPQGQSLLLVSREIRDEALKICRSECGFHIIGCKHCLPSTASIFNGRKDKTQPLEFSRKITVTPRCTPHWDSTREISDFHDLVQILKCFENLKRLRIFDCLFLGKQGESFFFSLN